MIGLALIHACKRGSGVPSYTAHPSKLRSNSQTKRIHRTSPTNNSVERLKWRLSALWGISYRRQLGCSFNRLHRQEAKTTNIDAPHPWHSVRGNHIYALDPHAGVQQQGESMFRHLYFSCWHYSILQLTLDSQWLQARICYVNHDPMIPGTLSTLNHWPQKMCLLRFHCYIQRHRKPISDIKNPSQSYPTM